SSSMVQLHVDFRGVLQGVRVTVHAGFAQQSDDDDDQDGGIQGELVPTIGELLHPFHVGSDQFVQLWQQHQTPLVVESRLFLATTLGVLIQQLTHALNLSHINAHQLQPFQHQQQQSPPPVQLVGKVRSDKDVWMLATIEVNLAVGSVRIQVAQTTPQLPQALLDAMADLIAHSK
ncbi:hypothetical protein AaE_000736, partial [Aphanomyces astaci]